VRVRGRSTRQSAKTGRRLCWGVGRHILGSQIFDYVRTDISMSRHDAEDLQWFDPESHFMIGALVVPLAGTALTATQSTTATEARPLTTVWALIDGADLQTSSTTRGKQSASPPRMRRSPSGSPRLFKVLTCMTDACTGAPTCLRGSRPALFSARR
jgi:hypothetical protein